MESAGFTPEDYEQDDVEVWPENWHVCCLFKDLRTQWRAGSMGDIIGLDYNVLFRKMDRMNLSHEEYDQLEDDVRVMEYEALAAMQK